MAEERAVLAGGCFWGAQDLLRRYDGVLSTRVGYTGGGMPHATYRNHDPSTRNRQGNDVGSSYRSAISSEEQKRIAEDTIADVDASGLWPAELCCGQRRRIKPPGRASERKHLPHRRAGAHSLPPSRRRGIREH